MTRPTVASGDRSLRAGRGVINMSEHKRHPFFDHPGEVAAREDLAERLSEYPVQADSNSGTEEVLPPHLRQGQIFSAEARRQKLLRGEIPFYDHGPKEQEE